MAGIDDDRLDYLPCRHCGCKIERINFALGPEWRHWPTPYGNYVTAEKYRYCRISGMVAEPMTEYTSGDVRTHSIERDNAVVDLRRWAEQHVGVAANVLNLAAFLIEAGERNWPGAGTLVADATGDIGSIT